ncbi:uncharacterized protein LOC121770390 [Salvia splendens]|uniref:uncharacterized protein LOC121770390 n=1 Tax=Salvia splendens TaxID=180675 RepID=UPI001C25747E|nr:uncharacterized protein LOC121770390 [Salvia splendens]
MPKRGRPRSQASQEADKLLRVDIEDAVDDIIPVALATKLRQRLAEIAPGTSGCQDEPRPITGRKHDRLYSRRTPSEFIDCLKRLNPRQKKAVTDIGFGAVLDFDVKEIPPYLAYWVLSALNLPRCQIQLTGGEHLTLDEEDVHLTLGFPRGPKLISRPEDKQSNFGFNDQVAERCQKGRFKMTPKDIAHLMMAEVDGGDDFKKLFMFLLENALIETPSDGHCKPKILHFIDHVADINNLNWCGYVLSVLEATHPSWSSGQSVVYLYSALCIQTKALFTIYYAS